MEDLGQADGRLVAAAASASSSASPWVLLGMSCALFGAIAAWPFAIDDALISIRYARHLAFSHEYVWNLGGPVTDGVTPLPWAFVLAPFAHAAPLVALFRAKVLGGLSWAIAASLLGRSLGRLDRPLWAKLLALAVLALSLPVAAHAVSGMETGLTMALATLAALSPERPRRAALLAGLATALRPELLPWSLVLSVGYALSLPSEGAGRSGRELQALIAAALASAPFVACALVRVAVFGSPAPLSLTAKPSDLSHGLAYAGAAFVFALAPMLLVAPVALSRERGPARVLALAGCAHCLAIIAVGGDWMPYARLMAPIVPSLVFGFVLVSSYGRASAHLARCALAVGFGAYALPHHLAALREAGRDRRVMIDRAMPLFEHAHVVAALDIGWVSAMTEETVVDLAGVTDPEIAALGGGHTSKRVDPAFLLARGVDEVVFYSDDLGAEAPRFPRVVEGRLAATSLFQEHYVETARLHLSAQGAGYVIFRPR